jgi:hypothetical protein
VVLCCFCVSLKNATSQKNISCVANMSASEETGSGVSRCVHLQSFSDGPPVLQISAPSMHTFSSRIEGTLQVERLIARQLHAEQSFCHQPTDGKIHRVKTLHIQPAASQCIGSTFFIDSTFNNIVRFVLPDIPTAHALDFCLLLQNSTVQFESDSKSRSRKVCASSFCVSPSRLHTIEEERPLSAGVAVLRCRSSILSNGKLQWLVTGHMQRDYTAPRVATPPL